MSAARPLPATPGKIGILIVNLGTPDAPTPAAVRRYLAEFLSDPRVVEIPQIVWQPILRGIILRTRPRKSARAYAEIWREDGSPLAVHTRAIAQGLAARWGGGIMVDWAMRYGSPSIAARLEALTEAGCARILILPLYPQYCGATTASVMDAIGRAMMDMRAQPTLRVVPPWYDDPAYIGTLAARIRADLAALDFAPEALIASFHGMPERTRVRGDPYYRQCLETAQALGDALGRAVLPTFQSRFGRAKWLEPDTAGTLAALPGKGVRSVAVVMPGFAADCLETLEEIGIRGAEQFRAAGGENFAFIRCLNAEADAIHLYGALLERELAGWVTL